jgi:uncharacterized iron-regulated membrane protein
MTRAATGSAATAHSMKRTVRLVHKYLSLGLLVLWLLQAVTGVLLVFHWELDDLGVAGPRVALNPYKLDTALERFKQEHPGQTVNAIYTSGGLPGRLDVVIDNPGGGRDVMRVDGEGRVLRERPWNHDFGHIGFFQIATYLHQTLFLHATGNWIMAISGVLLLSNICLGLYQAWPRRGHWRRTLWPFGATTPAWPVAALYQWHRALGLALALPALVLIVPGIVRALDDPLSLSDRFEAARPPPVVIADSPPSDVHPPALSRVLTTASTLYPGSQLAGIEYPDLRAPWYAVRLTQFNDVRRYFGTTIVYISSRDGTVLKNYDSTLMPLGVRIWDAVYALHTGEIAGVAGRCLVLLVGLLLLVLMGFGLSMYLLRRGRERNLAG